MSEYPLNGPIDTLIYDFDGTLIDSGSIVINLINELRLDFGLDELSSDCFIPWMSMGGEFMIRMSLQLDDELLIKKYLDLFRRCYLEKKTPVSSIYPGAIETLEVLVAGGYRLGICTNKPRVLVQKILKEIGMEKYFKAIHAGGDLILQKPHPDTLYSCINKLSSTVDKTLLIGDSTVDQRLADACRVGFVFYAAGYDDGVDSKTAHQVIKAHENIFQVLHGEKS